MPRKPRCITMMGSFIVMVLSSF